MTLGLRPKERIQMKVSLTGESGRSTPQFSRTFARSATLSAGTACQASFST